MQAKQRERLGERGCTGPGSPETQDQEAGLQRRGLPGGAGAGPPPPLPLVNSLALEQERERSLSKRRSALGKSLAFHQGQTIVMCSFGAAGDHPRGCCSPCEEERGCQPTRPALQGTTGPCRLLSQGRGWRGPHNTRSRRQTLRGVLLSFPEPLLSAHPVPQARTPGPPGPLHALLQHALRCCGEWRDEQDWPRRKTSKTETKWEPQWAPYRAS